jgi:NAD(P)-dependent dehydrogenase (short-subunit alcohol dehydrogenase family)
MKDVIVTGAGSGIGRAVAEIFSQKGARVFLIGRTEEKLIETQKHLPSASIAIAADITKRSDLGAIKTQLAKNNASISVVVNNAGVYKMGSFEQESPEDWMFHFNTNLFSAIHLTQIVWDDLKKNKGCVVNVSSTLGLRPIENTGAYSASKAAMNSWTQTLALEGAPAGVRVNAICPGLVDTPIHSYHNSKKPEMIALRERLNKLQPLGRVGTPEEIADAVYFAASDDAKWMTGALLPVDGGVILTTKEP